MNGSAAKRVWLAGALVIGAYLLAATYSVRLLPVRPLYDGIHTPQPYNWVKPPKDLTLTNLQPVVEQATIKLGKKGSEPFTLTGDGQAVVNLPAGAVGARAGESTLKLVVTPLDPARFGAPPEGLKYEGNAVDVSLTYSFSGQPARLVATECPPPASGEPSLCPTLFIRFPFNASGLYRRDGDAWTKVPTEPPIAGQVYGDTPKLGVFVAAGTGGLAQDGGPRSKVGDIVMIGLGTLAVVVGVAFGQIRSRRARAPKKKVIAGGKGKAPTVPKKKR